jgi:hypothetical protein
VTAQLRELLMNELLGSAAATTVETTLKYTLVCGRGRGC